VTLIVVSLITIKLSDAISIPRSAALDRSLGFLFGAARGLFFASSPSAFQLARSGENPARVGQDGPHAALLQATGYQLMPCLPMPDWHGYLTLKPQKRNPKAAPPQRGGDPPTATRATGRRRFRPPTARKRKEDLKSA